ncbi:MAG: hypothetical protein DYG83_12525, partial [Candidatus Brocadia sp. AMX2]
KPFLKSTPVKSMVSRRQIPKNDLFGVRIAKVGLTRCWEFQYYRITGWHGQTLFVHACLNMYINMEYKTRQQQRKTNEIFSKRKQS